MKRLLAFLLIPAVFLAAAGNAHHGSAGQFDHSKTIEVSGVVQKIRFVNPHSYVYFNVTADDGSIQEWRCEMRAASVLKRAGWSADMFTEGTVIDIKGVPARREPYGCYVDTLALNEGDAIERYAELEGATSEFVERDMHLADGTPNLSGNWVAQRRARTGPPRGPGGPVGMGMGGGPSPYAQSAAGFAAVEGYDSSKENPRFHCQAVSIFHDFDFDQHVNTFEQTADKITITYGFMDIVRTIHLDMDAHPDNIEPSRAGHSIGKWEGDTLVVDTIGFTEGFLDPRNGVKHSDQLHTIEKFTRGEDGKSLVQSWVGEDPVYLTAPFEGRNEVFATDAAFDPYNCEDLTEEIVEGF